MSKAREQVRIDTARLHYPHIVQPRQGDDGRAKHEVCIIFSRDEAMKMGQAIENVRMAAFGNYSVPTPLYASEQRGAQGAANGFDTGTFYCNPKWNVGRNPQLLWLDTTSNTANVVDFNDHATIQALFYPGAWVRAVVDIFSLQNKYGTRVSAGLVALIWLAHGEPLQGDSQAPLDATALGVGQVTGGPPAAVQAPAAPAIPGVPQPAAVQAPAAPAIPGVPQPVYAPPGAAQGAPPVPGLPGAPQAAPGGAQVPGMPGAYGPPPGGAAQGYVPPTTGPAPGGPPAPAAAPAMPGQQQPAPPLPGMNR